MGGIIAMGFFVGFVISFACMIVDLKKEVQRNNARQV